MAEYISYQQIPIVMGIKRGDTVLLTSDITDLYLQCQEHGEQFDPNILLDKFQEAVGEEGTLLIPTYNWGFCKGKTFNYLRTPSKTGAIGNAALRRKDFVRTKHPIYSFAVWGKDADEAVHNAVVLEEVAKMATFTEMINKDADKAPEYLRDKHFYRKHGENAYYGQN